MYKFLKRSLDLLIAAVGLVILLPLFVVLSILISLYISKSFIFIQIRPGLNGRPFKMYKFKTMSDVKDDYGQVLPDEQRLGRLGRLLRSTSLDELPELWNVLIGQMSLVGPRPLLMEYLPLYSREQFRRHEVKPGISGWAQINGRNAISWHDKFRLDLWYVDNKSILLDLKIIYLTVIKVIIREGISSEHHVSTEKFTGND